MYKHLLLVGNIEKGREFLDSLSGDFHRLVFNEEVSNLFLDLNIRQIAQWWFHEKQSHSPYDDSEVDSVVYEDDRDVFVCDCLNDDGSVCGKVFYSSSSLWQHVRHTKQGNHGTPTIHNIMLRNECPNCLSVYSSLHAASTHIRRSADKGYCIPNAAIVPNVLKPLNDLSFECKICHDVFLNVSEYYKHALTHFTQDKVIGIKCVKCELIFDSRKDFEQHVAESKVDDNVVCISKRVGAVSRNLRRDRRGEKGNVPVPPSGVAGIGPPTSPLLEGMSTNNVGGHSQSCEAKERAITPIHCKSTSSTTPLVF